MSDLTQRSTGDSPDGRRETPEGLVSRIAAAPSLLRECRDALAEKDAEIERLRENNERLFRAYLRLQDIPEFLIDQEVSRRDGAR